jgi:hypothetical protein
MKYKCLGSVMDANNSKGSCDYTFEWKDVTDTGEPRNYFNLPQKHKDHLAANRHIGYVKANNN